MNRGLYLVPMTGQAKDGAWMPFFPGIQTIPIACIQVYTEDFKNSSGQTVQARRFRTLDQYLYSSVYYPNNINQQWCSIAVLQLTDPSSVIQNFEEDLTITALQVQRGLIFANNLKFEHKLEAFPVQVPGEDESIYYLYLLYGIYKQQLYAEVYQSKTPLAGGFLHTFTDSDVTIMATPILLSTWDKRSLTVIYEGPISESIDMKTVICTDYSSEKPDGYSDVLRNKIHSKGFSETGEIKKINEKQPNDYIDFPIQISGNNVVSDLAEQLIPSGDNAFIYGKWRFDNIPGFDEKKWLTLNFNGLNQDSDPIWEQYGKVRLDSESEQAKFLPQVLAAGDHIRIDNNGNTLTFNAIDYVEQINGDTFIQATETAVNSGKKYDLKFNMNLVGENGITVTQNENTYTISYNGQGGGGGSSSDSSIVQSSGDRLVILQITGGEQSTGYTGKIQYVEGNPSWIPRC